MRELDHLLGLAATGRVRRSRKLIVLELQYAGTAGRWSTLEWTYAVPYAFRDALDIRFLARMKNKRKVMRWTQGPLLAFSVGDVLHRRDGAGCVQVMSARAMTLGEASHAPARDLGYVGCKRFDATAEGLQCAAYWQGAQLDFLRALISGAWPDTGIEAPQA